MRCRIVLVNLDGLISIYLTLAGMLATLVTLMVAGLIAIYQVVGKQMPRRSLNSVISLPVQITFIIYTGLILIISLVASWMLATSTGEIEVVNDPYFLLWVGVATVLSYGIFIVVLFKGQILFDNTKYVAMASKRFSTKDFADYLFGHYSSPPFHFRRAIVDFLDDHTTDEERRAAEDEGEEKFQAERAEYEAKISKLKAAKDPLGEMLQYALRTEDPNDAETIVIPLVRANIITFIEQQPDNLEYLAGYLKDAVSAMLASKSGTPSIGVKRAYIDMIASISSTLIVQKNYSLATSIATQLHVITRDDKNDSIRIYAVQALNAVTDAYDKATSRIRDWRKYLTHYGDLTLIAARMAENYYHNLRDMPPLAIVEGNHHEIESFHGVLGNYLLRNERLYDRFPDVLPVLYFDTIDLSAEAFAGAISRSETVARDVGLTRSTYTDNLTSYYYVFFDYGSYGVDNEKYELVDLCVYRLRRGLKFCNEHKLTDAETSIATELYQLGVKVTSLPDDAQFGELAITGKHDVLRHIADDINLYTSDMKHFKAKRSSMEHDLFHHIHTTAAAQFGELIDWDRDDPPTITVSDLDL